jgi:hypothetical protein
MRSILEKEDGIWRLKKLTGLKSKIGKGVRKWK